MSEQFDRTNDEKVITIVNEPTIFSNQVVILTDEPPIGGGAGSFFFDLNFQIGNIGTPTSVGNIAKYRLDKNYTGIASVKVLTEKNDGGSNITFNTYAVQHTERHAKLILTLSTNSGNKTITLPVDNNGSVAVEGRLRNVHDATGKRKRPHRAKYADPDSKVIAWKIVDSQNQIITDGSGRRFEETGDDLYYFYISMYH